MSQNSDGWQNPKDVMRVHRIKVRRQSSTKGKSRPGLVRSFSTSNATPTSSTSRLDLNSSIEPLRPNLKSCKSDDSILGNAGLPKRRNPFSLDSEAAARKKRKSILDSHTIRSENHEIGHGGGDAASRIAIPSRSDTREDEDLFDSDHEADAIPVSRKISQPVQGISVLKENRNPSEVKSSEAKNLQVPPDVDSVSQTSEDSVEPDPPVDWSLKTKMRVVVSSRENSFKNFPGIEARHVDSFIHHDFETSSDWNDLDVLQKVRRCCFHYSFPRLPWVSSFPRIAADCKNKTKMSLVAVSEDAVKALNNDWCDAFTSAYQQLRASLCPYFYLCTHQFTVLFRCIRSGQGASLSALLSPSTRGFRELLTKEGVEFRMPNVDLLRSTQGKRPTANESSETSSSCQRKASLGSQQEVIGGEAETERNSWPRRESPGDCDDNNEDDDDGDDEDMDDIDDHHGASRWLEGMGLDKKDFPSLEPFKVKLQREGFREIDNRPQSLVYVEGVDVHPFFNFLLNFPSCTAISGPQHGIPPTILCPVPFVGGTLVQNNVKHTLLKDGEKADASYQQVFEVSGPVLPHHTLNLATILRRCPHAGPSSLTCNTHLSTCAFNTRAVNDLHKDELARGLHKLFVDHTRPRHGLHESVSRSLASAPCLDGNSSLKELHIGQDGFSWS